MTQTRKINRIVCLLLTLMIAVAGVFFALPVAQASTDYSMVRVKIGSTQSSVTLTLTATYTLEENGKSMPSGTYTIKPSGSNVSITGNGISYTGSVITVARGSSGVAKISGAKGTSGYLGDMKFYSQGGLVLTVNHVEMEEYLYGVVWGEMGNYFPLEALKAQAITARGYACRLISDSGLYDLTDGPTYQSYKGYNASYTNTIKAVDATKGLVLKYDGEIIQAFYSASNGGQTEVPGNPWGGGEDKNKLYPYYVQKDDKYDLGNPDSYVRYLNIPKDVEGSEEYAPVSVSGSKLVRIMNCNEYVGVYATSTSTSSVGRANLNSVYEYLGEENKRYKINYNGKSYYVSKDYARVADNGEFFYGSALLADLQQLAYEKLKSQGISIAEATDVKLVTVKSFENGQQRWGGASRSYVTANATLAVKYIPTGGSLTTQTKDVSVTVTLMEKSGSSYSQLHDYLNKDLGLRFVTETSTGYTLFCGRYGHGIGMSQRGAQAMARDYGMTYDQILAFYYEGAVISRIDETQTGPEPGGNVSISSQSLVIKDQIITGVPLNTKAAALLAGITVSGGGKAEMRTVNGATHSDGTVVTGDIVRAYTADGKAYTDYWVVIRGDASGDGKISLLDLLTVQRHLLESEKISGAKFYAADLSGDGKLSLIDLLTLQRHLLGTELISQGGSGTIKPEAGE